MTWLQSVHKKDQSEKGQIAFKEIKNRSLNFYPQFLWITWWITY